MFDFLGLKFWFESGDSISKLSVFEGSTFTLSGT